MVYLDAVGVHCKHHDLLFCPSGLLRLAVSYATPSLYAAQPVTSVSQ